MRLVKTIAVGGVAEKVAVNWDQEREFRYHTLKAYVEIMRELEAAGYLRVVPLAQCGNYAKRAIILDLPGLRRKKPSLRPTAT
jgi:hypothetical protein